MLKKQLSQRTAPNLLPSPLSFYRTFDPVSKQALPQAQLQYTLTGVAAGIGASPRFDPLNKLLQKNMITPRHVLLPPTSSLPQACRGLAAGSVGTKNPRALVIGGTLAINNSRKDPDPLRDACTIQ